MASSLLDRDFSPPSSFKDGGAGDRWRMKGENLGNERWRSGNDSEGGGGVNGGGGGGASGNERWSRRETGGDRTTGTLRRGGSRERSPRRLRDRGGFCNFQVLN